MSKLVDRLREGSDSAQGIGYWWNLAEEAADRIDADAALLARVREYIDERIDVCCGGETPFEEMCGQCSVGFVLLAEIDAAKGGK